MHFTVKDTLEDPTLFATCAMAVLVDRFGAECVNWEMETFEMEIRGMGVNPSKSLMDKIGASCSVLSNDLVHYDATIFNNVVQVFNFDSINSRSFLPASLEDVLWGCTEMKLLEGPEQYDGAGFSADIAVFVGQLLSDAGVLTPPDILSFARIPEKQVYNRDFNLGGDSIMFSAYWEDQKDAMNDIASFCTRRTNDLLNQLASLPLKHMDNEFVSNVKDILSKTAAVAPMIPQPQQPVDERRSRKVKIVGSESQGKTTVASKPLPPGTDLGKVTTQRSIITPTGQAFVTEDLREAAKDITPAYPGNTTIQASGRKGEPHMVTAAPVQAEEPITVDLNNQNAIPRNIKALVENIKALKARS